VKRRFLTTLTFLALGTAIAGYAAPASATIVQFFGPSCSSPANDTIAGTGVEPRPATVIHAMAVAP
jgi:hypothetical protein